MLPVLLVALASTIQPLRAASCPATSPLITHYAGVLSAIRSQLESERTAQAKKRTSPAAEYDYIIVGGGTSGSVLANRLSEDAATRVLLLERGGTPPAETTVPGYTVPNLGSAIAEIITTVKEPQNCNGTGCTLNVPNVLGGGSAMNGMLYVRGSREDYESWASITGDKQWGYDSMLTYFKKAEDNLDSQINNNTKYHGRGGPLKVSWERYRHPTIPLLEKGFQAVGFKADPDINADSQLGYSITQTTTFRGERWSTYRAYIQPALRRANLHVETFATAKKVVVEKAGSGLRAVGVQYKDVSGKLHVIKAKKEVVLSAGALHTPQILMLSGIGPAKQLKALNIPLIKDLPVGENLIDHTNLPGIQFNCVPPLCDTDWKSYQADIREYEQNRTGPLSSLNLLQFLAFARSSRANPRTGNQPDTEFLFLGGLQSAALGCLPFDGWRLNAAVAWVTLMKPQSRGWVRLNTSDPEGAPLVKLNYLSDAKGTDLAVALEGYKTLIKMEPTLAKLGLTLDRTNNPQCAPHAFGSDEYLRCVARTRSMTLWHWSGTCRMGRADDPAAVVDPRLRVRGVAGLRLADGSTIPEIPSGNTNAPLVALAERAADMIKADARSG